jgi:hypothetical protein
MWDIIHDLAPTLWQLLPEATIGLRFGTSLIGFSLAVGTLIRTLCGQERVRRSSAPVVNPEHNRPDQQTSPIEEPKQASAQMTKMSKG